MSGKLDSTQARRARLSIAVEPQVGVDSVPTALREAPNLTKMNVLRVGVGDSIEAFYLAKQSRHCTTLKMVLP